jgi:hypothetical protein
MRGAELLLVPASGSANGLLVLHADVAASDTVACLRAARSLRQLGAGRCWGDAVLHDIGKVSDTSTRATALSFLVPRDVQPLTPKGTPPLAGWSPQDQWLWELASTSPYGRYPPDPEARDALVGRQLLLSRDWRVLVLRDGAAFLGMRPEQPDDSFFASAEAHFRSVYVDAFLLGDIQRLTLGRIADAVAVLDDPVRAPDDVRAIERDLTRFRNVYWHQQLGQSSIANEILAAYSEQHHLRELAGQLFDELGEYSRQVQLAVAERSSLLLGVITVVGLPFALALGTLQALGTHKLIAVLTGLGIAAVASTLLLMPFRSAMLLRRRRRRTLPPPTYQVGVREPSANEASPTPAAETGPREH